MAALKAHEVARFVDRPDAGARLFLAYGTDAGLVHETARRLAQALGDNGSSPLVIEGGELDAEPSRLAVEAQTGTLFGERRAILIRGSSRSLVGILGELGAEFDLPIVIEAGNLAPRDALRVLVEAAPHGRALPCYPDGEDTLRALIDETFRKAGIRVERDVLAGLRDILGNDREVTRRELEKLVLFAGEQGQLTEADVAALCADNGAVTIDTILDSTGTGHLQRLDAALARAGSNGVDPQRLLAMAAGHFATLRRWRSAVDAGKSARAVLDETRPKPHFSRRTALEQQLRLWHDDELASASTALGAATAASRTQPALAEALLRDTLMSLCQRAARF